MPLPQHNAPAFKVPSYPHLSGPSVLSESGVLGSTPRAYITATHAFKWASFMAQQAPHITRDQDLWFEDGNIVVVANGTWAFRVYKGMLARISLVFEDTFKFSPGGQTMDGAPVFHVHDHPIDLKHFLEVAFSPAVE